MTERISIFKDYKPKPPRDFHNRRYKLNKFNTIRSERNVGGEEHEKMLEQLSNKIRNAGYTPMFDYILTTDKKFNSFYCIDLAYMKDSTLILFEVGFCPEDKILDLMTHYPVVIHIPYSEEWFEKRRRLTNECLRQDYAERQLRESKIPATFLIVEVPKDFVYR